MNQKIFPKVADNNYSGSKIALYTFLVLASVGIVRSCIHLLATDGGAGSIAGMDLNLAGANNIIFSFALWGSSQLLMAIMQLIVYFRYKSLIPLMYILVFLEIIFRMTVGHMKPPTFAHVPPGQISNFIILPLSVVMFFMSVRKWKRE
jgi:hypothetical protein